MPEKIHRVDDVFGVSRNLPLNYIERDQVDGKLIENLTRKCHIVIYGISKQGKTCLRKYCLDERDYKVISCQNRWSIQELHGAILKECGYSIKQTTEKTSSGVNKIAATLSAKASIPGFAGTSGNASFSNESNKINRETYAEIELDPGDANDIIRALKETLATNYIVLEDFHYLPNDTQRDFSFSLKAFHEKSDLTFIIIGVWREQNRLITFNGDLTDRVFSIDVDTWNRNDLAKVIEVGEQLLNIHFSEKFVVDLLENCFNSVHLVQEACRRCLRKEQIYQTQTEYVEFGSSIDAKEVINEAVNDQKGRYMGFLQNFADGFQQTELEMPKWIVYAVINSSIKDLEKGLRLK